MIKKMIFTTLLFISCLGFQAVAAESDVNKNDSEDIKMLIQAYAVNWNNHDIHQLSEIFTSDVDFVTVTGLWLKNREAFFTAHENLHKNAYKNSHITVGNSEIKILNNGLALVHWYWEMQGVQNPDETEKPAYKGIFTWMIVKDNEQWHVRASHNSIF